MQTGQSSTLPTLAVVLLALATPVVSVLSSFVTYLFTRRKQVADKGKTEAETREIDSGTIVRASTRIEQLVELLYQKDIEIMRDKQKIANLEFDASAAKTREDLQTQIIRQAHAELEMLRKPK